MAEWLDKAWQVAIEIWNYELIEVEGESLNLGRVFIGTVLMLLAVFLSRRLSTLMARRVLRRFHLSLSAVGLIQTLAFYVFLLTFTLIALRVAAVPLTVFAVLGSALAIGVAFGSQQVVNNFISGLILMVEQPVKVGDLIEVEGAYGTVERIGARSTMVRTPHNTHIVVPNSHFLEKAVINWTLSDNMVRSEVKVGVAYGSPVEEVSRILEDVAALHERVLTEPDPFVLFTDFGDNALGFELVFWLRMDAMVDRRRIQSDLRIAVDERFRRAGIVVAFPQRDIHLDSVGPVQVQLLTDRQKLTTEAAEAAEGVADPPKVSPDPLPPVI